MAGGALALVLLQILYSHGIVVSKALTLCTDEGECSADLETNEFVQVNVTSHSKLSDSKSSIDGLSTILRRLSKEHFWALSQQLDVLKSDDQVDKISEKTMMALFAEQLQHLTAREKSQLQLGISNTVRSNYTDMNDMVQALLCFDELSLAEVSQDGAGDPHVERETVKSSIEKSLHNLFNKVFDSGSKGMSGVKMPKGMSGVKITITSGGKTLHPVPAGVTSDVKMPHPGCHLAPRIKEASVPDSKPEVEDKCVDFRGKFIQHEHRRQNEMGLDAKCEVYTTDVKQEGCKVTALSKDAWWGHSISLPAHGNGVQIALSPFSSRVFKATLSDDGNTVTWNDGCKWERIQETTKTTSGGSMGTVIAVGALLAGGLGFAYFMGAFSSV